MDANERIAQWEKMTREAPDGMAWVSLGNAYKDADRPADAAEALRQAINLDDGLSRAYQTLGEVLISLGNDDDAGQVLADGYTVAAERGDLMPQKAIASLLKSIGKPVPEVEATTPHVEASGDQIIDRRTNQPGTRMAEAPMRGPVGTFIRDHYSQETWRQWIAMGTKVINELRLDFSNEAHQKVYEQQMMEWLGLSEEDVKQYADQSA